MRNLYKCPWSRLMAFKSTSLLPFEYYTRINFCFIKINKRKTLFCKQTSIYLINHVIYLLSVYFIRQFASMSYNNIDNRWIVSSLRKIFSQAFVSYYFYFSSFTILIHTFKCKERSKFKRPKTTRHFINVFFAFCFNTAV